MTAGDRGEFVLIECLNGELDGREDLLERFVIAVALESRFHKLPQLARLLTP